MAYAFREHWNAEKALALVLPVDHPKRKELRVHSEELRVITNEIKD